MQPWWTDNYFGVWLGVAYAIAAVIIASACAWFIYRGERREIVRRTVMSATALGAAALVACLAAFATGQHFRVWYPLAMMGGASVLTLVPNLIALDWLYRRHDNRRLAAEELRRS